MHVDYMHFLVLAAILFGIGFYGVLTRRNAIGILMCLELMFNAVNINFVTFSKFITPDKPIGQIFAIFVIVIAAAEATAGLAIVILIYRNFRDVFIDKINIMKW
jgi:NADH:ubiquinone oxidoreductase subunit K